jgi:uncharacterized membrane protein
MSDNPSNPRFMRSAIIPPLGILGLMCGLSLYAWPHLPADHIATHFGPDGQANGWSPRQTVVLMMPLMGLGVSLLLAVLPKISPKRADLTRSAEAYGVIWTLIMAILALVHALILFKGMGWTIDPTQPIHAAMGLMLLVMGNYLPKTRYNYFLGIRTPWTLADERVWDRTHRFAGPLFMLGGIVQLVSIWLAPLPLRMSLTLPCVLIPAFAAVFQSYLVAKKLGAA